MEIEFWGNQSGKWNLGEPIGETHPKRKLKKGTLQGESGGTNGGGNHYGAFRH